jgi:hypothetical protein
MSQHHWPERATAEEKFARRQRQAEEAVVAMGDHEKAMKHRIANTERLKALRLARDAELAKNVEPVPTSPREGEALK